MRARMVGLVFVLGLVAVGVAVGGANRLDDLEAGPVGKAELDDRQIVSFVEAAGEIERERLLEACRVCPVDALVVLDEDGGQPGP